MSKSAGDSPAAAPANGSAAAQDFHVLEDLTSYNGVFVNGLRIHHSQDLSQGDLVQIGDYRIILQDESQAAVGATTTESDPSKVYFAWRALRARGRPARPTQPPRDARRARRPGPEYPLDHDLMTVGRAEEATISVNHNSVSRMHCEIQRPRAGAVRDRGQGVEQRRPRQRVGPAQGDRRAG